MKVGHIFLTSVTLTPLLLITGSVMNLPFSTEQFLAVFEAYNQSVWPSQVGLNFLALVGLYLANRPLSSSGRAISAILAFLWLWIGIVYHFFFFTAINPAAYVFAVLNILQAFLFLEFGLRRRQLEFEFQQDVYGYIGALLILYALLVYPILGSFLGHAYPKSPTFGLPCPTTIYTFGLLLWTRTRTPVWVLLIPLIWSFIGFSAAITMGIQEDIGLLVAGICGTVLILMRNKKRSVEGN